MDPLDDPGRLEEIRHAIESKPALKALYAEFYRGYAACLGRCPEDGLALELGSGAGFAPRLVPGLLASDTIPYAGMDLVADGTRLPFADGALRLICMTNVLHHIPDAAAFFREAVRCLRPGGRVFLVDQYPGRVAGPILRYAHHEPFDPAAREWAFATTGPLSGANGALAWIIFARDRERFERLFPELEIVAVRPHTPLRYWLAGGLKRWSLLPGRAFGAATALDHWLMRLSSRWGSFMDVELVRREPAAEAG